jgi:uncharacterized radical SAM protein YgiQ
MIENEIAFLPTSAAEMKLRGWRELDIVLVTGDAYVDHSAFGVAVIGRVLASEGYRVGIIAQPDWRSVADFQSLGRPRLFFGITSGNVDSMVANYTANKRPRKKDDTSPGGRTGFRPDRALIVYANRIRQAFKGVSIVVGGLEASMRRLAHYDYWDNRVRRSILFDARADLLVYGMGERQVVEIARRLSAGETIDELEGIAGTAVIRSQLPSTGDFIELPSLEEVTGSKEAFNRSFALFYKEQNPMTAKTVCQAHGDRHAVVYPPPKPLSDTLLDEIYELDYQRSWHPSYDGAGGVPGLETVRHSLVTHRGCCGECNFCSLFFHQGRIVQSRSAESIVREAKRLTASPGFRGTITDMGGPTANLYGSACSLWKKKGYCSDKRCMFPSTCPSLDPGYGKSLPLYRRIRKISGVKHAFVGSGFRHDLFAEDTDTCLEEICRFHVSGQMKVAPEHVSEKVLRAMGKPRQQAYDAFVRRFERLNRDLPSRRYLVNYFISAHPGCTLNDALELALYLIDRGMHPEQVQDFIPLPLTHSGAAYFTGKDPLTEEPLYVARTFRERKMQRALVQYKNPSNRKLIRNALKQLGKEHLARRFFNPGMEKRGKRSSPSKGGIHTKGGQPTPLKKHRHSARPRKSGRMRSRK